MRGPGTAEFQTSVLYKDKTAKITFLFVKQQMAYMKSWYIPTEYYNNKTNGKYYEQASYLCIVALITKSWQS